MSQPGDDERTANATVEAALRSFPLAPAPRGLARAVMARVQAAPRPRFRLGWLDYALSVFATLMAALLWLGWQRLPKEAWPVLLQRLGLTLPGLELLLLAAGLLAGVLLASGAVLLAALLFMPGPRLRSQRR